MSNYNPEDFAYFVLLQEHAKRSASSFNLEFYDLDGFYHKFEENGGRVKRIKFDKAYRQIRVPKKQEKLVEMLRNHPLCLQSPNNNGGALYKEMREAEDAKVAVNATKLRNDAMNLVFECMKNEDEIEDLALVLNIKGSGELSHSKLLLFAERNPQELLDIYESKDFKAKALVRKAIERGILQRKGLIYMCGETDYGTDFEEAVKLVLSDTERFTILDSKLGKINK